MLARFVFGGRVDSAYPHDWDLSVALLGACWRGAFLMARSGDLLVGEVRFPRAGLCLRVAVGGRPSCNHASCSYESISHAEGSHEAMIS